MPTTGRMEHLREGLRDQNLSEWATELVLKDHGDQKLTGHMTHSLGAGVAGVLNGMQIPFLDL